ncbi:hypothetical protein BKA69DRAFT_1082426 [Paraphysoderma sedebokerense]|nr:hypothetical protein BKA69DRAFT_1082426 [Paraphysoderma sedebokerense]
MYVTSKENLISSTSILEFFKGQDVVKDKVPVYAMINEATGVAGTFDVYYFVFFPYNYGKSMCIWGSDKNGNCRFGAQRMFGNHVGDFEFVALRFTNDQPTDIFISTHLTGKHYKFDSPELEKTDTHVHIYNALGSHGFHNKAGKLKYNDFPPLYDETDAGVEWKSWEGPIEIYNVKDKYEGEEAWLGFQGRWGNKTPCKVASSMSLCQLENGPWTFRGIRLENGKLSIKQGKTF